MLHLTATADDRVGSCASFEDNDDDFQLTVQKGPEVNVARGYEPEDGPHTKEVIRQQDQVNHRRMLPHVE